MISFHLEIQKYMELCVLCTYNVLTLKNQFFFQVWKAEAENICGYDGTVLVAVKTTKDKAPDKEKSGKNLFTFLCIFLFT